MNQLAMLLASVFSSGTVLALAALGLLINEKSGVINLGAEGLMLCAALAGFAVGVHTGNGWLGFAAGMAAGAVLAGLLGVLVIWLNANQYAAGLALSLFGAGLSAFMGTPYTQASLPAQEHFAVPLLSDIPLLGQALFMQHPVVYVGMAVAVFLVWFLYRSRAGLILRSVGEAPQSAHALGYNVRGIRLGAMVAGKGWIALALTSFATWRPLRVLLGAWLFGGVTMLQFWLQSRGVQVPSQMLTMLPYVTIIVVLALISRNPAWIRLNKPSALGKPFYPQS